VTFSAPTPALEPYLERFHSTCLPGSSLTAHFSIEPHPSDLLVVCQSTRQDAFFEDACLYDARTPPAGTVFSASYESLLAKVATRHTPALKGGFKESVGYLPSGTVFSGSASLMAMLSRGNVRLPDKAVAERVAKLAEKHKDVNLTTAERLKISTWLDRASHIEPGRRQYAACTQHMDAMIGKMIAALETGETKSMGWDKLIQPLGKGSYDVRELLRFLRDFDYKGPIGVIGFGIEQPARQHLKQSTSFWKATASGSDSRK